MPRIWALFLGPSFFGPGLGAISWAALGWSVSGLDFLPGFRLCDCDFVGHGRSGRCRRRAWMSDLWADWEVWLAIGLILWFDCLACVVDQVCSDLAPGGCRVRSATRLSPMTGQRSRQLEPAELALSLMVLLFYLFSFSV